jgi:hypothetical protein
MAVVLSMGLPGLGHFYLHRRVLGTIEVLIGLGLFAAGIYEVVLAFLDALDQTAPVWDVMRVCLKWAPILIGYSILSGVFTWVVSRHRCVSPTGSGAS